MNKNLLLLIALIFATLSCSKDKTVPEISLLSIELNETDVLLNPNNVFQFKATLKPDDADNKELQWSSSNPNVATISNSGEVKAIELGETTISVKNIKSGISATSKVTVVQLPISKIELETEELEIELGSSTIISIKTLPDDAPQTGLVWTSSDEKIATVTDQGVVTSKSVGVVTITVTTAEGNVSASVEVTVKPILMESIKLDKDELTIKEGSSETLIATITPENATDSDLTWTSADEKIATVTDQGVVKAITEGETIVTVSNSDKSISETVKITVLPRFVFSEINKAVVASDGLTVTVRSIDVNVDEYGTYSYYMSYTLQNNTKEVIDEKTFKMFAEGDQDPVSQYGFFGKLFPGDKIDRAYLFKATYPLDMLEYDGKFLSNQPGEDTLKWKSPKVK